MAAPSIANIYPAVAHTSGRALVRLLGAGFAEQIAVTFNGAPSPRIIRVKDALAYVAVPKGVPGPVTVRLQNLDDAGLPVAGELAEAEELFEFRRAALTDDSTLTRVVAAFIKMLRNETIENVTVAHVHTDYDAATGDTYNLVEVQKLPAIVVIGPQLNDSEDHSNEPVLLDGFGYQVPTVAPRVVDLVFELTGMSGFARQLLNLQNLMVAAFRLQPYIEVLRDPEDPAQGTAQFPLEFELGGVPSIDQPSDDNNVREFGMRAVIRNVPIGEVPGLEDDGAGGLDVVPPVGDCGVELTFVKL